MSDSAPTNDPETENPAAPVAHAAAHLSLGMAASLLAGAAFVGVFDLVSHHGKRTTQFDRSTLLWMEARRQPRLTQIARVMALLGSPRVIVSLGIAGAVAGLVDRRIRGAAWTLPVAIMGAGALIQAVKWDSRRKRPDFLPALLDETGYSFPSGHSLIAVTVYGLLAAFARHLVPGKPEKDAVTAAAAILIASIGVSRVYVGVHYPTDVIAGWTAGIPWLATCLGVHERLARKLDGVGEPVLQQ